MEYTYTIFTPKRDRYLYGLVLTPTALEPVTIRNVENMSELLTEVRRLYGMDAMTVSAKEFERELEKRHIHTPEVIALLERDGELIGMDLTKYLVYGSARRPVHSPGCNNIASDVVCVQCDHTKTGFYTYLAVPTELPADALEHFSLTFVSRPALPV